MKIARANAKGVAERWKAQYYDRQGKWMNVARGSSEDIYNKLCALGVNPSPSAAAKIIGNTSWTHLNCVSCSKSVLLAIDIGADSDANAVYLCRPCVVQAAQL